MDTLVKPMFWDESYWEQFKEIVKEIQFGSAYSFWSISEGTLHTGFKAPFGGVLQDSDNLNFLEILKVFQGAEELASVYQVNKLIARLPPDFWNFELVSSQRRALIQNKWNLEYYETDQWIEVNVDFESTFNRNRKRDLKTSRNLYVTNPSPTLIDAYDVLCKNRKFKGVPQNLPFKNIESLNQGFPGMVLPYLICDSDGLNLAAAIGLIIDPETIYIAQWGDLREDVLQKNLTSPMTFLAWSILSDCTKNGITRLYLGSSSLRGELDLGLFNFKESLGAKHSRKEIWCKYV